MITRMLSSWLIADRHMRISVGYVMLAVIILLPAFLLSRKYNWNGHQSLIRAMIYFCGAVVCRIGDATWGRALPMGTHFIWHILGGMATYYMLSFLLMFEVAGTDQGRTAG
jgi:hemolysin III